MKRLFGSVGIPAFGVLVAWALTTTGCGSAAPDRSSTDRVSTDLLGLVDCTTYNGYTAALAEATVDCTGTIGPNSFDIDVLGLLSRNFSTCTGPGGDESLLRIDRLLSLQLREGLSLRTACFAEAWTNWLLTLVGTNLSVCPVWTKLSATGSPTPDNVAQNAATLPPLPDPNPHTPVVYGKEQFVYSVRFPAPLPLLQLCRTPQSCARLCSGGLAGFFVGESGGNVIGDPYWWLDPTDYGGNSPYSAPYWHPMSYADDDVPGAIYGDWARRGEWCSWWNGVQHVLGRLWEDKLDPGNPRTWTSRCD